MSANNETWPPFTVGLTFGGSQQAKIVVEEYSEYMAKLAIGPAGRTREATGEIVMGPMLLRHHIDLCQQALARIDRKQAEDKKTRAQARKEG